MQNKSLYAKVIVDIVHSEVDRVFEYLVPEDIKLSVGYRVRVPFGQSNALREGYIIGLSQTCSYPENALKSITEVLSEFAAFTEGQIRLAALMRRFYHTTLAAALRLMFPAQMRGGRIKDKYVHDIVFSLSDVQYEDALESLKTADGRIKAPKQLAVLEYMHGARRVRTDALNALLPGSAAARDALVRKGLLKLQKVKTQRAAEEHRTEQDFELTDDQKSTAEKILNVPGKYLLHGVTGSGKTEVYISIVRDCLARGKSAIVLVPEISLTPQLVEMFARRIGYDTAVYHSTLTARERYEEWKRMATGKARVVIGARSAVFAPLADIGVIIIDEEHETSYKSDTHPKYTAHEIARMRAGIENCSLVFASATPSVESYIKAKNGIYTLIEMPCRLFGLQLPSVEIADMRDEITKGNRTIFSGLLYNEMREALLNNRQVMLFINRRGYSTFVMCRACGHVEYCSCCEVTLTYHATRGALICHYCGRSRPLHSVCPQCAKPYLKHFGIGTQQVEEQTKARFPDARVLRMDLDTTRGKDAHKNIYERFKSGEADILIGTQMIAKGLDFSRVSLVGVVAADNSLFIPDYRSPEKTFQLLEQVAGRAGRKDTGKVVIQTYCPEHYAIKYAKAHDYKGFFDEEMRVRRSTLLPPYSVFFRFVFTGKNEAAVRAACQDFSSGLKQELEDVMDTLLLFDVSEAPIKKIEGRVRWQILLKALNDGMLAQLKKRLYIYTDTKRYRECSFGLEINPLSMI